MNQKLDVARIFERIFQIYRDQFTLLVPAALVVFVPVAIISGLVYGGGTSLIGVLIVVLAGAIATYWFQGMVVEAALDILDGRRDHTVGSLLRSATPVIFPLLIAGILAGIAFIIGFVLLIVPGLLVLTFTAVVAPVIVIERTGVADAFRRSIALVRGNAWQVFGVIVVLFLLQFIVSQVITALADSASDSFAAYALADLVVHLLVAPLAALAAAVLYFELRGRKEGAGTGADPALAPAATTSPTDGPPPPPTPEAPSGSPQGAPAPQAPPAPEAPPPPEAPPRGTESGEPYPPR